MGSQLNFVVFAPGRSGTTAFAHGFNAHPNVFCAVEFFPPKSDHSVFEMPRDMLELHLRERANRLKSIEILKNKLADGNVSFYGNKMPNYYFRLEQLRKDLPELKLFYIYRSPVEFVESWDRRAMREGDRWPEGRLGIFGTIEQIFCLRRLAELPFEVSMVSYRSLFFEEPRLMSKVVSELGAQPTKFNQQWFEQEVFQQYRSKPVERLAIYEDFFREFRFDILDDYFARVPLSKSSNKEFLDVVAEQFSTLPSKSRFAEFVHAFGPAAAEFSQRWRRQVHKLVDNPQAAAARWLAHYVDASAPAV
jgi:hypothetical protein